MIIYYHCTRDSGLLQSFLLTCHPHSFHDTCIIIYTLRSIVVHTIVVMPFVVAPFTAFCGDVW